MFDLPRERKILFFVQVEWMVGWIDGLIKNSKINSYPLTTDARVFRNWVRERAFNTIKTLVKSSKTIKITRYLWIISITFDLHWFRVNAPRLYRSNTCCIHFDTSLSFNGLISLFFAEPLSRSIYYTRDYNAENWLGLSTNDRRLYDIVITLFITTKQVLCSIPNSIYSTLIIQRSSLAYKAIVSFVSVHFITRYSSPSSHKITMVLLVLFWLSNVLRTQTNRNKYEYK